MTNKDTAEVIETLKKMTPKDIMGVDKFDKPEKATHLFTIYGACDAAQVKPTQFNNDQYVLHGRSRAVRNDGKKFQSLQAYLPEPFQSKTAARVPPNKATGEVPSACEFAFLVGIAPSKKGALGYSWTCEPMMDERTQDALASVEALIANKIPKALPAAAPAAKK